MNTQQLQQLLITVLLPAAVSIIVVYVNNVRQKKLEFNYDYRKYILEKRKKAYDEIEQVLNVLADAFSSARNTSKWIFNATPESVEKAIAIGAQIQQVMKKSIWLSEAQALQLSAIRHYCAYLIKEVNKGAGNEFEDDKNLAELDNSIFVFYHALERSFFKDLTELDNLTYFNKMKKKYQDQLAEGISAPFDAARWSNSD